MFDKKDMMVSLLVAEEMIKNTNNSARTHISELAEKFNATINSMKNNSNIKGLLKIRNSQFIIGNPTPYFSNGIQLFTGDEVSFRDGKKGIIAEVGDNFMVYTNREISTIVNEERMRELSKTFASFDGYVLGNNLNIKKHFNELKDGEEIAKGRKGASGFIVYLD